MEGGLIIIELQKAPDTTGQNFLDSGMKQKQICSTISSQMMKI